jgi:hypothetical protein
MAGLDPAIHLAATWMAASGAAMTLGKGGANPALRRFRIMPYVQSSALRSVSYDEAAHALRATFRASGRSVVYEDVPQELYDALMFADSIGAFFNTHIRGRFRFHDS